ncbi:MAG: 4'-phosphopantetheinyl transferase superfamily protein [Peptococcaceae bacterium]|nr:4'-phosphopantetheinyl transferase superfamily protein [Peptococcaceae bacterium]
MPDVVLLCVEEDAFRDRYDDYRRLVASDKQERLDRFRFFADAQRSLLGDLLARVLICERTGLRNETLLFGVNAYGKPLFENDKHVHFNVSHSGKYIVCGIDDAPVGIDIECIQAANTDLARRFFAPAEIEYIVHAPAKDQAMRFYQIWTQKESYIKWQGMGLAKSLPSFSVLNEGDEVFYHLVFRNHEAICHVCTEKAVAPVCKVLEQEEFAAKVSLIQSRKG